jgi:hypothetical protein
MLWGSPSLRPNRRKHQAVQKLVVRWEAMLKMRMALRHRRNR